MNERLEELLSAQLLATDDAPSRAYPHLLSLLELLNQSYAVVGTIALGIHARPRFTRTVQILTAEEPSENWRRMAGKAGYSRSDPNPEYESSCWSKGQMQLSILRGDQLAVSAAIASRQPHRLFDIPVYVAQPTELLWIYLTLADTDNNALPEAIELINHGAPNIEHLRSNIALTSPSLTARLEQWLNRADHDLRSTYSASVERRLKLKGRRSQK
jgi:hypothetical protein